MSSSVQPDSLFSIDDLSCSYSRKLNERVLWVEKLSIPKNKITFLLGPSGSGKSTLLETLGLMNNTRASGTIAFYPDKSDSCIQLESVWETAEAESLNVIRKKYYSFIFQENNLLENFSAYENICFSQMVKDNRDLAEVAESASSLMDQVKLPASEVTLQTRATQLSGGQRQRLAFVRALNTKSLVLFCDEPTGNLDEVNANELMCIIRMACSNGSSAIIVSHDINLALKYGDQISVITKRAGVKEGMISAANIFYRPQWENHNSNDIESWKEKIRSLYSEVGEKIIGGSRVEAGPNLKTKFPFLFIKNELRTLLGKRLVNYWILFLLSVFTFLVLGFANGSLHYIESKRNDIFVNWLTVKIPWTKTASEFSDFKNELNKESNKQRYHYSHVTSYPEYILNFLDKKNPSISYTEKGRTIEMGENEDPMLKDIVNPTNILHGGRLIDDQDLGIIVNSQILEEYHYTPTDEFINVGYQCVDENGNIKYESIPVKIRAVVKAIPGKNQFITTQRFYSAWLQSDSTNTFDIRSHKKKLSFFLKGSKEATDSWFQSAKKLCETNSLLQNWMPEIHEVDSFVSHIPTGRVVEIILTPEPPDTTTVNSLAQLFFIGYSKTAGTDVIRFYDLENFEESQEVLDDYGSDIMCVNFSGNMDSIRQFKNFLYKLNTNRQSDAIQLDESTIREKENFNYMSKVTWIISIGLLFFSIFSIAVFISNILRLHLLKVKMNIGTLKAFGLSDAKTSSLYMRVMLLFVTLVLLPAYITAFLIGRLTDSAMHTRMVVDSDFSYFIMADAKIMYVILAIFALTMIVVGTVARKILLKSPGDLIYNR